MFYSDHTDGQIIYKCINIIYLSQFVTKRELINETEIEISA